MFPYLTKFYFYTPHKSHQSVFMCTTVCSGPVERKPSFDEWALGSICNFWFWLMRCVTELRLIQVMETYGHFWSIRCYVRQPCISDIMWSAGNGARLPVAAGRGTNTWVMEDKGSGEWEKEQQVNTYSQLVTSPHEWPCFIPTILMSDE